ncbi:MAG: S8 family serine peptidase [Bacteroidota bacterium]|nr:S8 family serine peptidase [Candidatus Kapabacteria bacterium]MDW8220070.1 S8 family serine peptidase [Bacteroidota bacterium]
MLNIIYNPILCDSQCHMLRITKLARLAEYQHRRYTQWCRVRSVCYMTVLVCLWYCTADLYAQNIDVQPTTVPSLRYEERTILLKIKKASPTFHFWNSQARRGSVPLLEKIVGKHTTEPLFDDGLIEAVRKRFEQVTEDSPVQRSEGLARWCRVRYASSIDALALVGKLRRLADVEDAEPSYYAEYADTPNDPFLPQQGYLQRIRALDAWDVVRVHGDLSQTVVIAIVDSGVDYQHEDLSANIWINPGESGTDAQGRDKRTNGIDDDRNGRIDDWRGWDFAGSDGRSEDNDPIPERNDHGTHVAGIAAAVTNNGIGIAGVARGVQIMPLKASAAATREIVKSTGFRAIVYAAAMGATVINCSWGDESRSRAEQEAVAIATELGALVVAAAGNNNRYMPFYPASYEGVCSVAWVEDNDVRLSGNYHETVDIAAPGTSIFATYANNRYGLSSGTSMAAPMVSAAAAMVRLRFPRIAPEQILVRLKAGADNIDNRNPSEAGLIGVGRLNILNAVQTTQLRFVEIVGVDVRDDNAHFLLESGERVTVSLTLANRGQAIANARIAMRTTLDPRGRTYPFFQDTVKQIPSLTANEVREHALAFTFRLTTNLPQNFELPLLFSITDVDGKLIGRHAVRLVVNRAYQTLQLGDVGITVNSRGNFGFNDYPFNTQGDGAYFVERDTTNLLYEGGVMIASGVDSVSTAIRETRFQREQAFVATSLLSVTVSPDSTLLQAKTAFEDLGARNQAGVRVEQHIEQYRQEYRRNLVVSSYTITNATKRTIPELHAGLFFDWDIGDITRNETYWDTECECGIARSLTPGFPILAVKLLSPHTPSFYPMTTDETDPTFVPLSFDFSRSSKYKTLSSGVLPVRKHGDIAHVVGAQNIALDPGTSVHVRFGIAVGLTLEELYRTFRIFAQADSVDVRLYPNPAQTTAFLEYRVNTDIPSRVEIELLSVLGHVLSSTVREGVGRGWYQVAFDVSHVPSGMYVVRIRSHTLSASKALLVSR